MNQINESIICAGFGGQGIMILGKVLATAGMEAGLSVTWLPAYGAEVRGGTAYSAVKISSKPVSSAVVDSATVGIIMNEPSFEKFESKIAPGGLMILNSSLVETKVSRTDLEVVAVPLSDEAVKLGNVRVANMMAAGIYAAKREAITKDILNKVITDMSEAAHRKDRIAINIQAVEKGYSLAK